MDTTKNHETISHEHWLEARQALLEKEKAFTRARDELSRARQALPWERVEADYAFQAAEGPVHLAELFEGRNQLIVYHFMYGPDWAEGCKSCSFLADHLDPAVVHLNQRDVSVAVVSRAPLAKIQAYQRRMGWTFRWVSSLGSDFNRDYHVSFTEAEIAEGSAWYNYRASGFDSTEAPGASVFFKDEDGTVYHTYSVYSRGLDMFLTAYHYLDIVPKGRDEASLSYGMEWLMRHDEYGR